MHFRFRELESDGVMDGGPRYEFPAPWDEFTFRNMTEVLCQSLPNLTTLFMFLQGPLITLRNYSHIIHRCRDVSKQLKCLKSMTVRFPRTTYEERYYRQWFNPQLPIKNLLSESEIFYRVIQPHVEPGGDEHDVADLDTGTDGQLRVGTMYTAYDGTEGVVESRHYAVPIVEERATKVHGWS